jgi:hypothetical protein
MATKEQSEKRYKFIDSSIKILLMVVVGGLGWFANELWTKQNINTDLIYSHETSVSLNSQRITRLEVTLIKLQKSLDSLNGGVREVVYELRAIRNGR